MSVSLLRIGDGSRETHFVSNLFFPRENLTCTMCTPHNKEEQQQVLQPSVKFFELFSVISDNLHVPSIAESAGCFWHLLPKQNVISMVIP